MATKKKELQEIKLVDIEDGAPFVIKNFTKNGLPIVQIILDPVGYKRTKRYVLIDSILNHDYESKSKKFLTIEQKLFECEINFSGSSMEIYKISRKRTKTG